MLVIVTVDNTDASDAIGFRNCVVVTQSALARITIALLDEAR